MSADTWYPAGHNDWCSVNLTPERFAFRVNTPAIKELDFESACDLTVQTLYQEWGSRPLYLSLSGGLDSEVIADTFVRNRIPFVPIILCVDDVNSAELQYAESWCRRHNIDPLIKNLTIVEYTDIIKKYLPVLRDTQQTGITVFLYLADFVQQLGGCYVNGVGDINQEQDQFYCNVVDFALDVFCPGQHPTGFFMYTAEVALAYIKMFDSTADEQYNKLTFYNVLPRSKVNWMQEIRYKNIHLAHAIYLWSKTIPDSQPHWFGNKQDVINVLKGNL